MGTDIHLEVERLGEDGIWHWIEHPERPCDDDYCTDGRYNDKTPNEKIRGEPHYRCNGTGRTIEQFWRERNYDTFAILADVRNGSGFAGCDTGDGFVPIAEPRGLPDDLGPEITNALARYETEHYSDDDWDNPQRIDLGEHSFSWLTVAEILDYDWTRTTTKRGWVDPWNFEVWRNEGKPHSWSGGVTGATIKHISPQAMGKLIDSGELEWIDPEPHPGSWQGRRYTTPLQREMAGWGLPAGSTDATIAEPRINHYAQVEWEVPYTDQASSFLKVLHRDIIPLGDPHGLRIVFGFDS